MMWMALILYFQKSILYQKNLYIFQILYRRFHYHNPIMVSRYMHYFLASPHTELLLNAVLRYLVKNYFQWKQAE